MHQGILNGPCKGTMGPCKGTMGYHGNQGLVISLNFVCQEFFENPAFRADGLKIYPTLVIRGTGLYELWKRGLYHSYPPNTLVDLVATILSLVPPWVRIYRVQRDIPMPLVRYAYASLAMRQKAGLQGIARANLLPRGPRYL